MATGKVKWFSDSKGYGFIQADDPVNGLKDVFVHYSEIASGGDAFRSLAPGQLVKFELTETSKGLQARKVETMS